MLRIIGKCTRFLHQTQGCPRASLQVQDFDKMTKIAQSLGSHQAYRHVSPGIWLKKLLKLSFITVG